MLSVAMEQHLGQFIEMIVHPGISYMCRRLDVDMMKKLSGKTSRGRAY